MDLIGPVVRKKKKKKRALAAQHAYYWYDSEWRFGGLEINGFICTTWILAFQTKRVEWIVRWNA